MRKEYKQLLWALGTASLLGGCAGSSDAVDLASTAAGGGAAGVKTAAKSLTHASTAKGFAMAHTAAVPGLLNPGTLLSSGVSALVSANNARRNEAAASKVAAMAANGDRMERGLRNMVVVAYNRKHGTHFRSYDEIMDHEFVADYNKHFHTKLKSFDECRKDFNRRAGTRYKNVEEFRQARKSGEIGRLIKSKGL